MPLPDPAVAARVQSLYADSLKQAKVHLKRGRMDDSLTVMQEFFANQEDLAEYFHPRTVDEVHDEMKDRLEQAQTTLASIVAEYPDRAKQFMSALRDMVNKEFEAFQEMKAQMG